jgi:hypothetical protein
MFHSAIKIVSTRPQLSLVQACLVSPSPCLQCGDCDFTTCVDNSLCKLQLLAVSYFSERLLACQSHNNNDTPHLYRVWQLNRISRNIINLLGNLLMGRLTIKWPYFDR